MAAIAIPLHLVRQGYQLTNSFMEAGIDCPQLLELNRWIMSQQIVGAGTTTETAPATPLADFNVALEAALKSSPRGVAIADLRDILKPYEKTPVQIGAALGRMAKAGKAQKVGELWFTARRGGSKVTSIDAAARAGRRTRRATTAGQTDAADAAGAATTVEQKQPMAAAG